MELVEHELNRAIRFGAIESDKPKLYGSNLVRAIIERYGFMEGPTSAADFNLQSGILFRHGYYEREVIERLHVYDNGMLAELKADTDVADAFLDDVASWASTDAGLQFSQGPLGRIYMSQLVVKSDSVSLTNSLTALKKIGERIGALAEGASPHRRLPHQVSGFHIQTDPGSSGGWNYRFEARAGRSFDDHLYFSSAPLKTKEHIGLLEEIEKLLS